MKNLVKFLVPAAVAALALVSCNTEENYTAPEENAVTIRVHASANDLKADEGTKTYIDTYNSTANTILWGTGEYMKLAVSDGTNTTFASSTDASADLFNGEPQAMFEFSLSLASASSYTYQGIYPESAASTSSNTNAASFKVNLPTIQNATAASYDPAAYIMVAKPETFNSVQEDWNASFRRATALNKITLKNVPTGVSFNKVKITAEGKKLAGGRHFDLTVGEGTDVYGTEATIEVKYTTALTGTNVDVWFTSWDVEIEENETLTIVAYTTDNKSYTRSITVPAGKSIKFQEGYLNTLGVSLTGITPENVATIDGDYVILAKHNTTYYALKGEASTTRIASVDYTGSTTSYEGDASIIWTITPSGSAYTIKNGDNYLGWTSGSGNAAALIATADYDADKCLMGIDDNGDGTYKIYVAAETGRILAKNENSTNAYFAFYGGTQYKDIVLVPATALAQVATPTFDPAAGAVASGSTVTISCATSGATIHYTVDGTDPTSSSATYSSPITITTTTTIKAIAVKDGMADSEIATATYTISGASTPTTGWLETELSAISAGDVFAIVANETYAIPHDGSSAPVATSVTISGSELVEPVADNIKWNLTGNSTDGYIFYPNGNTSKYLRITTTNATGSNDNLRINTGSRNVFVLDSDGHLLTNDEYADRYIGLNGTSNFRGYVSATSNVEAIFKFYKYVSAPDTREESEIEWSASTGTADVKAGVAASLPTLTNPHSLTVSYSSSDPTVATVASDAHTVTPLKAGTTQIHAVLTGDATYKDTDVYYTLTVSDTRETVATPVILPAEGTVSSGTEVTITCTTDGATIHYTLDNSTPDSNSTLYSGAITLTASMTVKAIAVKNNYKDSAVASATYTVGVANTSTEDNPYSAADADALAGQLAANGTLDDVYVSGIISQITTAYNSTYGNVSFNISADGLTTSTQFLIFRANASSADDFKVGDAVEFKGTLKNFNGTTHELDAAATLIYQVHAPSFTPDGGSFTTDTQSVTISADSGATIRYTDDGTTDPTASTGTVYSSALSLTATTTIKAVAILNGHVTGVVTKTFTKGSGSTPESIVYDFTGTDWSVSNGTLTNGTVSFTGSGPDNFKMNSGYFMLGKSGAYITFPTYSYAVTKIVVTGRSGASGNVKQNIYVGDTAVSTETTGATGTNTYNIASGYQAAGTTYVLKVTSSHNTQITKIEVFF